MTDLLRVGIAELRVDRAPSVLACYGLGSCVAISLYDPELCIGGVAHALLPGPVEDQVVDRPGKFVSTAVGHLVDELLRHGAEQGRLQAKLCGGASMFQGFGGGSGDSIGERNLGAAKKSLAAYGIPIVAADVALDFGRTMEFDLATGMMRVRTVRGRVKLREL
ncbi:MAG: chemoreceptor glutamine deamidase CheD [Desulfuromonas sp.]|nr:MAG: chemoreceptor glutamine deamidase CheD [Desulfuromonas sp.]